MCIRDRPPPNLYVIFPPRKGDGQRFHGTASSVQNRRYPSGGCGHPPLRDSSAGCPNAGADTPGRPLLPLWGNSPSALIGPRQLSSTLTVGRPSWPPAGGDKPRPYITALEDILRRGRHPRAASLAPAGQFAFCPHRPAPIILYPRRRGGPRGRPRAGTSPVPTYWCGVRPAFGAPTRTQRSGSRGEKEAQRRE